MADMMVVDARNIMEKGLKALESQLELVEIEQFICTVNRAKNDYTEWRRTLFDDMTAEEFSESAAEYGKNHPLNFKRKQNPVQRTGSKVN